MFFNFIVLFSLIGCYFSQPIEGSGEENLVDEYWLQHLIDRIQIPHYLTQKAYERAENASKVVDDEEILSLDASVPEHAKNVYLDEVIDSADNGTEAFLLSTEKFMSVVFFAFRPFGCDQDNIWPSVYNLTTENFDCIAWTLMQKVYEKSEFTRKYFARAIHFGITSNAPMDHRIHEMLVYQYLLPTLDRVWFNNIKLQFRNSFWNEQETSKTMTYDDNSFHCGSMPFTDEVQERINYYYGQL